MWSQPISISFWRRKFPTRTSNCTGRQEETHVYGLGKRNDKWSTSRDSAWHLKLISSTSSSSSKSTCCRTSCAAWLWIIHPPPPRQQKFKLSFHAISKEFNHTAAGWTCRCRQVHDKRPEVWRSEEVTWPFLPMKRTWFAFERNYKSDLFNRI